MRRPAGRQRRLDPYLGDPAELLFLAGRQGVTKEIQGKTLGKPWENQGKPRETKGNEEKKPGSGMGNEEILGHCSMLKGGIMGKYEKSEWTVTHSWGKMTSFMAKLLCNGERGA